MVDDIKPHIIGITESWANNDITDAELGLEGYVMFRKDRIGRRGGAVLGAIQVLRNADGGGGRGQIFRKKALRRCKVQCY